MNELRLQAVVVEQSALRYTPANIPAIDVQLEHSSQQHEGGSSRLVKLKLQAVAFGTLAERLSRQPLNQSMELRGFLAISARSKTPKLHIQDFVLTEAAAPSTESN